ncbi:MAG: T9SS type A sorting domain-containing protein [Ignavibacteria bacterium]|nr:T9SS type A sorting domain-containing protein [Ignavibacteria bacterium]MBT8383166.1 T9SS type A sorting domain-containing protein [Ignavibacteria bacterium]MBT8391608.1 T9SS type A sorting domain-containing protein [Ignavibacteria bacterium]NNL20626.1 T9SS type A sorting domain-containing protein [Ignavibacteriaceae bacterium]
MIIINRIKFFLLVLVFFNISKAQDYFLFTDSENPNYYDPSYLFVNTPSELITVNENKFPVSTDTSYAGTNALKLQWSSHDTGDWGSAITAPNWAGEDVTLKDSVSLWVFSNKFIPSLSLPKIYLEDLSNKKTDKINISDFHGDIVAGIWTQIKIPIRIFINNPGEADLTQIKVIYLGQSISDSLKHIMYIDEVRITGRRLSTDYNFIVVLGSSTAAGGGADPRDSAWVNLFRNNLILADTSFKVVNLAVGGFTTYDVMPTGFVPPPGRPNPSPNKNITYAMEYNPQTIIINLPSNDVARNYTIEEIIANYDTLFAFAQNHFVDLWISTPQPRYFSNQSQLDLQFELLDSTFSRYGSMTIDFWNGLAKPNGFLAPEYDSGDGIHLNNAGHRILYERASEKIYPVLLPVELAQPRGAKTYLLAQNFPNPFNNQTRILISVIKAEFISLKVYNIIGEQVAVLENGFIRRGLHSYDFDASSLTSGIYVYRLIAGDFSASKKMILVK